MKFMFQKNYSARFQRVNWEWVGKTRKQGDQWGGLLRSWEKQMEAVEDTGVHMYGLAWNSECVSFVILRDPQVWKHWFTECKGNECNTKATNKNE